MQKLFPTTIRKGPTGDRSFTFVISTGEVDRDNDTVNPNGWDLEHYLRNPIVAWSHDYTKPPVARCTSIGVQGNALVAVAEFPPPGLYDLADTVYDLLSTGFLHATSVGFKPIEQTYNTTRGGQDITRQELLEFSIVSIPSNPDALMAARGLCDRTAIQKWFNQGKESVMSHTQRENWLSTLR